MSKPPDKRFPDKETVIIEVTQGSMSEQQFTETIRRLFLEAIQNGASEITVNFQFHDRYADWRRWK